MLLYYIVYKINRLNRIENNKSYIYLKVSYISVCYAYLVRNTI